MSFVVLAISGVWKTADGVAVDAAVWAPNFPGVTSLYPCSHLSEQLYTSDCEEQHYPLCEKLE